MPCAASERRIFARLRGVCGIMRCVRGLRYDTASVSTLRAALVDAAGLCVRRRKTPRRGASPLRMPIVRVILIKLTKKYGCLVMPGLTQCAVRASEQIEISLAYC